MKSSKYNKALLNIKKELMQDIASFFINEEFVMRRKTSINYLMTYGVFPACFDKIKGDKNKFALYNNDREFMPVIGFDISKDFEIDKDIQFLITLLDYVESDSKNKKQII
jgi:hypothetical protein